MQHKNFCFCEFIKTETATAVHLAFRLRFNIQPPTRKSICRWNHQFEQIDCLCKGKSSGRPGVSEENVWRIQESFERSKSTRRASSELGIPQPTVWRVLRRRLLFKWDHLFESPCTYELVLCFTRHIPDLLVYPPFLVSVESSACVQLGIKTNWWQRTLSTSHPKFRKQGYP